MEKSQRCKGLSSSSSTDKKFKKNKKTVTVKKQKTTKTTVKKLKAKKKYYVRVRTYKIVNGKKVYSSGQRLRVLKLNNTDNPRHLIVSGVITILNIL